MAKQGAKSKKRQRRSGPTTAGLIRRELLTDPALTKMELLQRLRIAHPHIKERTVGNILSLNPSFVLDGRQWRLADASASRPKINETSTDPMEAPLI